MQAVPAEAQWAARPYLPGVRALARGIVLRLQDGDTTLYSTLGEERSLHATEGRFDDDRLSVDQVYLSSVPVGGTYLRSPQNIG